MAGQEIMDILETTGSYLKNGHFKLVSGNHSDDYVHVRLALAYREHASRIGKKVADEFQGEGINVVAAFTVSGIALAQSVAKHLGAKLIFGERKEDKIIFARGQAIGEGDNVLVVDDVLTTGELIHQVLATIRNETKGVPKGVGIVVDRSKKEPDFGVKTVSLIRIDMHLWPPESCPKCEQGIPLTDLSSPDIDVFAVLYSLPEEARTVLANTYQDILTKLEEGKPLEEILTLHMPTMDFPGRKWERVAVLGSFDDFSSMDKVAEYVASLGFYTLTSKLMYEKNTGERKELRHEDYESMNDFLRKMIFSCQYIIIIYSVPGSGGQFVETAWCSESNKPTLGLVHFPPWMAYSPKTCDYLGYDDTQRIFFCNGFNAYESGTQLIGGWICDKRKACPFPLSNANLTKVVLDLYATTRTMFLVGGEPKNFQRPIGVFLKNKGVFRSTELSGKLVN